MDQELIAALERAHANLTLVVPERKAIEIGRRPGAATVHFHDAAALRPLLQRDHLALVEAYLSGRIDVEGDWQEVMKVTEAIAPNPTRFEKWKFAAKLLLRSARRLRRESIAFHYDRPPEFFLPWLERWRSYSHGHYDTPDCRTTFPAALAIVPQGQRREQLQRENSDTRQPSSMVDLIARRI